ncbi:hypothetical protein TRFO_18149 [Tritrichomonas foetus]|uniref:Uncharacterized protein n=1 Tax=Tritrichomonas foetus TaxID=1144522 RepID=A0A1J4KRR7_9EUKA|nr:hypothetical protein TRFO_18149 [Tritrichomonas foetus]|eukprot:OHT12157.1 hypothetical protein TRFO_18149 [Tritrichomonas foetus]
MSGQDSSSQASSRRRRHHHNTSSYDTASVSTRGQMRSFQPVPSIEKQLTNLGKGLESIKNSLKKSVDVQAFDKIAENFHDGLAKILADLIKVFTNSFRRGNPTDEEIEQIIDSINNDMDSVHNIFLCFRKLQKSNLLRCIGDYDRLKMLVEFWGFVEDNYVLFLTEFWRFCTEVNKRSVESYNYQIEILGNYITDHHNHLNELHLRFIRGINEVDLAKDLDLEEEDYSEYSEDGDSDSERALRLKIGDAIRGGYKLIFPILKECWENEFKTRFDQLLDKKDKAKNVDNEENNSDEDEIQLDLFIYDLYDIRLSQIETLYNMAIQLDNDDQAPKRLVSFIRREASKSFDDQFESAKVMWLYTTQTAPLQYSAAEMAHFGHIITYHIKSEVQYNPTPVTLRKIGELFRQAEELNDLQTAQELLKLLVENLTQKINTLEEMYKEEIILLNAPPEQNKIDDLKYFWRLKSDDINELALQIAESIRLSDAAAFIHRKNDPAVNEEEEEDDNDNVEPYPMRKEINELSKINTNFNDKIHSHIKELQKQLNAAYEGVITSSIENDKQSVKTGKRDDESIKSAKTQARNKKSQKMINDALSMCSRVSKAVTVRTTTRDITEKKIEFRTQIELIEEAICRTYEHLFASTRSLIVSAIRDFNQEAAEQFNLHLKEQFTIYLRHLEVLKKWYIEEMKVDNVQIIEARMEKHQGLSANLVDSCLKESFEDFIRQTVENYLENIEDIKDEYQEIIKFYDTDMIKRMDMIAAEVHIKQLEIIEQEYRIQLKKEKSRDTATVTEAEDRIRTLLSTKQYEAARREQEKLDKLKKKEWKEKEKEIKKKYDEIRKKKLEQQARDLKVLEDSFDSKKKKLEQAYQKQLEEQNNMLLSSISRSQQSHIQFSKVLTGLSQPGVKAGESPKKNANIKDYEDIVKRILKEYKIENVTNSKQKLPDFAVKTRSYRL